MPELLFEVGHPGDGVGNQLRQPDDVGVDGADEHALVGVQREGEVMLAGQGLQGQEVVHTDGLAGDGGAVAQHAFRAVEGGHPVVGQVGYGVEVGMRPACGYDDFDALPMYLPQGFDRR